MDPALGQSGILWGAIAGAAIVTFGGLYALFFGLARVRGSRRLNDLSVLCFLLLMISTSVLAKALNLSGFWLIVTAVMLFGYFFAPRAIWWLSVGTHAGEDDEHSDNPDAMRSAR